VNVLAGLFAVIIIVVPAPPQGPGSNQATQSPGTGSQTLQPMPAQPVPAQSVPAQPVPAQSVPAQLAPMQPIPTQSGSSIQNGGPAAVPGGAAFDVPAGNQAATVSPVPLAQGNGVPVQVSDPASLDAALANAQPGQTIELADGTYNGRFTINKSGQQGNPVTLRGSRKAIIDGGDISGGYTLHLDGANFWQLVGFSVAGAQKGIMTDRTSNTIMSDLDVGNTGEEGVHLGDFSSNNVLQNSVVHDTGEVQPGLGEGLYLGTAQSNWAKKSDGQPDRSDNNTAIDNTFRNTTAENIDVKEETSGGLIAGNSFDGSGLSGVNFADSVMDLKGTGYRIMYNITSGASPHMKSGFQTHVITDPATSGCGNTFLNNVFNVQLSGPPILLDNRCAGPATTGIAPGTG
jgi:hypothetical protein